MYLSIGWSNLLVQSTYSIMCLFGYNYIHGLVAPGYPGSWSSGDDSILKILDSSGVGQAVSPGKTVVYHSVPDVIDTRTEVCVCFHCCL